MTTKTTRRSVLAGMAGGAAVTAALPAMAANAYAVPETPATDPAVKLAAEWNTARDNLLELLKDMRQSDERSKQWRTNAIALEDAGERLSQIQPTTLAGAAALLGVAVYTLQPEGLVRVHFGFVAKMPVLDWIQRAHGAIVEHVAPEGGAS